MSDYKYEPKIKIEVTRDVHEQLRLLKKRGESFNEVLRRVMEAIRDKVIEL